MSEARTVTSKQARKSILRCFKSKRPLFLWGPPGIGKSELVENIATEMNGYMIDLRLAQMEPTDLRGIPFYNKDLNKMDWAAPVDLPDEELASQYPIVILFLDEMNSAAPSVQAAAYQLTLNRRIGKYRLPDNVVIVAAGNRDSDKGVTYRMPTPLANRFIHQEMKVDFNSWQEWAVLNRIHKDVVGYLSFAKGDLYDFDAKSASRSFATHRKIAGKLPRPEDILDGKVKDLQVKEVSAMYSLVTSLCYELKEGLGRAKDSKSKEEWNKKVDNFLGYMMANFETELTVMGARVALTVYELPFETTKLKNFDEFYKKFGKYILQAAN